MVAPVRSTGQVDGQVRAMSALRSVSRERFRDRRDAGRQLAQELEPWRGTDVVVLGLPRGGVPVAAEVAAALRAPLDVIVVRKVGVPWQPELALGAVGEDGVKVLNSDVVTYCGVPDQQLAAVVERERGEVAERAGRFRGERRPVALAGRTAVVVDDGVATGATARAACQIARVHGAAAVVLAVPVAPAGWTSQFTDVADACVALAAPRGFAAVGAYYDDFSPTTDEEVEACLNSPPVEEQQMQLPCRDQVLRGVLTVPVDPLGLIVFAHGSGSSHLSVRNRQVARRLVVAGFATALFDLLTEAEETQGSAVFDIDLLTERLLLITGGLRSDDRLAALPLGLFGASTGAAAALAAAASRTSGVSAVVSRGGRPDLAMSVLHAVTAPTLLVVGGADSTVLDLNRRARARLTCEAELVVIPGASHLFAEPGALDQVASVATSWFDRHLSRP
jgi:predicted phosphoribosyltransferase/dienelactone hydrolase